MSKLKRTLFDDDEEEEEEGELQINKAYATKYEEWRRGEEIEKLKNRLGEDGTLSSDSESSDDDYVEPDNPEFDRDFLITLGALHKKELISEEDKFFPGDYRKKDKPKEKKEKPMTIMDYQHHILVDRCGELDEDEDEGYSHARETFPNEGHLTKFEDDVSSDEDGDGLLTSGLFKLKTKAKEKEKDKPKKVDDAVAFVKGKSTAISNTSDKNKNLLEGLKDAWNDPKLSRDDKWLADFFLNKRYLDGEDESIEREYNEAVIDEEPLSDDENTLQTMEVFETKYRFRYEEPDEEFIKKYPRIIEDSVRAKDDRRKVHREAVMERKLQEKEIKKQEIIKLKALKYKEIEAKIEKIKEASGNDDIDFGDKDLDAEFDPDAHDSAMSRMFGNDYYEVDDGNMEKPVFSDDEDNIVDYDHWLEKEGRKSSGGGGGGGEENTVEEEDAGEEEGEWYENEDFNMDADYDEAGPSNDMHQVMVKASRRNVRRKSKFARALAKKKPVFDPMERNFDSYFDEYYQLNFEDIVGGMPCRFQYREVQANNFGLATEEILSAQDKELNKWCSLKKILRYDRTQEQENRERGNYTHRASLDRVKKKVLPSLFTEDPEDLIVAEQEKKRIKNVKKKLRKQQRQEGIVEDLDNHPLLKPREKHEILSNTGDTIGNNKRPLEDANEGVREKKMKKEDVTKSEDPPLDNSIDKSTEVIEKTDAVDLPKTKKKKQVQVEADEEGNKTEVTNEKTLTASLKGKRKKNKKQASNNGTSGAAVVNTSTDKNEPGSLPTSPNKKRKKKKNDQASNPTTSKKRKRPQTHKTENPFFHGISDTRLTAYGENPKKIKNKVIYGKNKY